MYTIEFEANVHNNTIQIPVEYKELEAKHTKVFLISKMLQLTGLYL